MNAKQEVKIYQITILGLDITTKNLINQLQQFDTAKSLNIKAYTFEEYKQFNLQGSDCVIIADDQNIEKHIQERCIFDALQQNVNVISMASHTLDVLQKIQTLCVQHQVSFYQSRLFPNTILYNFTLTLAHALLHVDCIKIKQVVQLLPEYDDQHCLDQFGFGLSQEDWYKKFNETFKIDQALIQHTIKTVYPHLNISDVKTELIITPLLNEQDTQYVDILLSKDSVIALSIQQQVKHNADILLDIENHWYAGPTDLMRLDLIYPSMPKACLYTVEIHGEPSILRTQFDICSQQNTSVISQLSAHLLMQHIPLVCKGKVGILMPDEQLHYQMDQRVDQYYAEITKSHAVDKKIKKVIIWGPGEIGGAVVRALLQRKDIEIVGAKVFSPHKNGQDLGTLIGIDPIGIKATTSAKTLLALDADVVIVTPQPRAIVEGLDQQVIEILKSGKNVITSAAYHNVSMPNWLMQAQTPTALLSEAINTHGIAKNKAEEVAFKVLKKIKKPIDQFAIVKNLNPLVNRVLSPIFKQFMPPRATVQQLVNACQKGQSTLHGTGVHPSFMAERIGLILANLLPNPHHMRFVEAVDFSYMPDGMWGGLNTIGFGLPVQNLNENFIVAKAGDFYYGDVTGNIGHLLYGYDSSQIRVERRFRAIAATEDFKVGNTLIRKGCAAALHMQHLGYVGDHHFFTNEECWYLGPNEEYRGHDLPYGDFKTPISYTVQVISNAQQLNMQLSMDGAGRFAEILNQADITTADARCALGQRFRDEGVTNPITNATAMAIISAIDGVCGAPSGVMIDDVQIRLRQAKNFME